MVKWHVAEGCATLLCKTCDKHRPESDFSRHKDCVGGFDTSRCKPCKKAKADWSKVPLEKRIYHRAKSRAKKKGRDFNLELDDIVIPDVCPVLGHKFIYGDTDWTYSIDRVDNNLGYVKGNVVIVSNKANRIKNSATRKELEAVLSYYF